MNLRKRIEAAGISAKQAQYLLDLLGSLQENDLQALLAMFDHKRQMQAQELEQFFADIRARIALENQVPAEALENTRHQLPQPADFMLTIEAVKAAIALDPEHSSAHALLQLEKAIAVIDDFMTNHAQTAQQLHQLAQQVAAQPAAQPQQAVQQAPCLPQQNIPQPPHQQPEFQKPEDLHEQVQHLSRQKHVVDLFSAIEHILAQAHHHPQHRRAQKTLQHAHYFKSIKDTLLGYGWNVAVHHTANSVKSALDALHTNKPNIENIFYLS